MNTTGQPWRMTTTFTNVGVAYGALTVTNSPPASGMLHRIRITKDGGTGTQIKVRLRESAGGTIIAEYGVLATMPLDKADGDLWYAVPPGQDLTVEVATDAGSDTDVSVELTILPVGG